jgi:hypothetical protein
LKLKIFLIRFGTVRLKCKTGLNGNMNPVLKRSGFVMNQKTFAFGVNGVCKFKKMNFGTSWLTRMRIAPILLLTGQ